MEVLADKVLNYFKTQNNEEVSEILNLPLSGGDRRYFRILTKQKSYIACFSDNLKENETFFILPIISNFTMLRCQKFCI